MFRVDTNTLWVIAGIMVLLIIGLYKMQKQNELQNPYLSEKSIIKTEKTQKPQYHLVVGSFINEEFAIQFADSLASYGSVVLPLYDGYYRVSIFSDTRKSECDEMKNIYKEDIDKIWIHYQ